ncbi:phosphate ABC transporter permease PstA [Modestobacter sp. URMC 112]
MSTSTGAPAATPATSPSGGTAPAPAAPAPGPVPPGAGRPPLRSRRRLPRWAPAALVAAGLALGAGLSSLTGFSIALTVVYGTVLGTLAVYVASRAVEGARKAVDRLVTCVVTAAFAIAMVPLLSLVYTVLDRGLRRLDSTFFTYSMVGVVGEGGGAYHAVLGTLVITALTAVISVPIGLLTAIYLVEYGTGRLKRAITFLVDVMTGIPSIVAGLFAYAVFALFLGPGVRLGIAGAVALSVLMIPVVVRSAEEVLKLVPNELREASYALGVPKWRTIVKVVVPTAVAGLATSITLAIARVVGETAPLLITVGITNATNLDPFDGRMATLPVYAYYQLTQPGVPPEFAVDRAWTAALILIMMVMALNVVARLISRFFAPKTGR